MSLELDNVLMDVAVPDSIEALVNEVEKLSVSLGGPANAGLIPPEGGLLLGSLYSNRPYAPKTLERVMITLWRPVYEVRMVEQEQNILLFSFENKVDLQRVLDDGPWRFDDHFLLLKEISDPAGADRELLRNLPIWVQMHEVPFQWLTMDAAHAIAIKLGEVLKVDENSEGVAGLGFLRARVEIDVADPLPRKMQVCAGSGSFWVKFRFERLPNFCYRCGMLDHTELYCKKPIARDENGQVQVWEQELRAFPPRRMQKTVPVGPRAIGFQRGLGRSAPASVNLVPFQSGGRMDGVGGSGREPFKRKRTSRMEGVVSELEGATQSGK